MNRNDEIRAQCAKIRERCDAATKGPWEVHMPYFTNKKDVVCKSDGFPVTYEVLPVNADFIAHAREDIPFLLAELDRLTEVQRWIPVTERLPESGEHVLLCCEVRPGGSKYVCDGYYAAKFTIDAGHSCDLDTDYDEEKDEYFLPEGFYEVIKNWDDYSSIVIEDFVTHWMPLPAAPKGE